MKKLTPHYQDDKFVSQPISRCEAAAIIRAYRKTKGVLVFRVGYDIKFTTPDVNCVLGGIFFA